MKEFKYCFAVGNDTVFEVCYYTLGSNKSPHFATQAAHFDERYRDYDQCGQAQKDLLLDNSLARWFYEKWDKYHLKDLTREQHQSITDDIKILMHEYPLFVKTDGTDIPFYKVVAIARAHRGEK